MLSSAAAVGMTAYHPTISPPFVICRCPSAVGVSGEAIMLMAGHFVHRHHHHALALYDMDCMYIDVRSLGRVCAEYRMEGTERTEDMGGE